MTEGTALPRRTTLAATIVLLAGLHAPGSASADARNNVLTVGMGDEPSTLDPATGVAGTDYPYLYSLYDRLIDFEPQTLALRPGLATEWRFAGDDRRTLVLTLREGVRFQDGTPLDSEAVKASLTRFRDMKRIHDLDVLTSVEVIDPTHVALHMGREYSVLPAVLSDRAGMIVSPAAVARYGADFARHPVGAGPFAFKSWTAGSTVELAAHPGYWDKGRIRLAGIQYRIILNPTSLVSALLSGQVDHAFRLDPKDAPALRANPGLRFAVEQSTAYNMISLNTGMAPVDNKLVRQALNMSIDRGAIAEAILGPGMSGGNALMPVPPSSWAYSKELETSVRYDPARARELLAQAGYPDGITLKVCATPQSGYGTDITDIEREQMRPAGVTLDVTVMTGSACLQTFSSRRIFPAWQGSFSGRPDPYLTYSQNFGSAGQYNLGHTSFPGVDALLERVLSSYSQAEQKPIYDELNRIWIDSAPFILLYYRPTYAAYSRMLAGEQPNLQGKTNLTSLYYQGR